MKYTKSDKKKVIASIDKWKEKLKLKSWLLDIRFHYGVYDKSPEAAAVCEFSQWIYKTATISFFDPFYKLDDEQKDETVLHEMIHIVLAPLTSGVIQRSFEEKHVPQFMFDDYHEIVTQDLTNILK